MLDSFMFFMSDEEYEKLCSRMGITKDTRISYIDFLDCFEVRDTADGHKWLNSVHRFEGFFFTPTHEFILVYDYNYKRKGERYKSLYSVYFCAHECSEGTNE